MPKTLNPLPDKAKKKSLPLLQSALCSAIDLQLCCKQAHWNIIGEEFISLHELFDRVAHEVSDHVDLIAERIRQLGGVPDGRPATVVAGSTLGEFPEGLLEDEEMVEALATVVAKFAGQVLEALIKSAEAGDPSTSDLFTEISRGIEKQLWFIEAHRED